MDTDTKQEADALVAVIWGPQASEGSAEPDPEVREFQNIALGIAIRAYLQSYLDDLKRAG